jgi:hypothetical protein
MGLYATFSAVPNQYIIISVLSLAGRYVPLLLPEVSLNYGEGRCVVVNQAQSTRIEIRCVGGDVVPHNVRAGDLAGLLEAVETLIVASVLHEHPELTRDDIIIGLTDVQNKSLGLHFTPSLPQIIIPEFERIAVAIQERKFDALTPDARDALRKIATFSRKHRCVTQLRTTGRDDVLATIDQELVPEYCEMFYA